mmetsp:Transcript_47534/g.133813  ORF Transcript_47534/g.133813 Transcript_47534/m.133813 type:complete len:239 (+) Transcript_47534:126-842(+)
MMPPEARTPKVDFFTPPRALANQLTPAGRVFEDSSDGSGAGEVQDDADDVVGVFAGSRQAGRMTARGVAKERLLQDSCGKQVEASWETSRSTSRGDGSTTSTSRTGTDDTGPVPPDGRTTVMLQRIPESFGEEAVRRTLDGLGYHGRYDAVYVPMKHSARSRSMRYAFVNFLIPEDAAECIRCCVGRPFGEAAPGEAELMCNADYANMQGREVVLAQATRARCLQQGRKRRSGTIRSL